MPTSVAISFILTDIMSRLCWLLSIAFVAAVSAQPLGIALDSYTYPHPVKFLPMQIEGQDLRMAYMDVPSSGAPNGRTVVLMHGKNFGGYYWANVIAFLASNGYRVVVPDQIGWGKSSKPDIRYSFHLLAANTAQLLRQAKCRARRRDRPFDRRDACGALRFVLSRSGQPTGAGRTARHGGLSRHSSFH